MEITPLPLIEEIEHEVETVLDGEVHTKCTYHAYVILKDSFSELIQRDDQAYTSLIEGIEGMQKQYGELYNYSGGIEDNHTVDTYNKALAQIIEKVVKPLYGKE